MEGSRPVAFVGILEGDLLSFRFCQISDRVQVDGGASQGRLELLGDGRLRLVESFSWESRDGNGVNIFEEIAKEELPSSSGGATRP